MTIQTVQAATLTLPVETLRRFAKVVGVVREKATFCFTEKGLLVSHTDPSNAELLTARIPREVFSEYVPGLKVGVDVYWLRESLTGRKGNVSMVVEGEGVTLQMGHTRLATAEVKGAKPTKKPELDLAATAVTTVDALREAITHAKVTGAEYMRVECRDSAMYVKAGGDSLRMEYRIAESVSGRPCSSMYSVERVEEFLKAVNQKGAKARVRLGENMPLDIQCVVDEVRVEFLLAPIIHE